MVDIFNPACRAPRRIDAGAHGNGEPMEKDEHNKEARPPVVRAARTACGILLLAVFAILAAGSAARKSATFDAPAHLTRGYVYWRLNDYRFQDNGNLPDRLMALPAVFLDLSFPSLDSISWRTAKLGDISRAFCFGCGNDFTRMLWYGRMTVIMCGVLLCAVVWLWSRRLFGFAGGLVSLALAAFSPSLVGYSRCAAADIATCLFFLLASSSLWRVVHRLTPLTLLCSCLATGGLMVTKTSSLIFLPIALLLLVTAVCGGRPLAIGTRSVLTVRSKAKKALVFAGIAAVHAAAAVVVIWAFFGFRYEAFHAGRGPGEQFPGGRANLLAADTPAGAAVAFARDHRLLPASYLYSLSRVLKRSGGWENYFFGDVSDEGSPWFFPFTVAAKTPAGTLAALGLAAWAALAGLRRRGPGSAARRLAGGLYRTAPLWTIALVYGGFALAADINIGHRHILPAVAALLVLAGAAGRLFSRNGRAAAACAAAVAATALASAAIYPHHLSFFNILSGGPAAAREKVVDSSLDWGQDLPALREWLNNNGGEETIYLTYFGSAPPSFYGVRAAQIGGFDGIRGVGPDRLPPPGPGIYCVSATILQGAYFPPARWDEEKEATYRRLRAGLADTHPVMLGNHGRPWDEPDPPDHEKQVVQEVARRLVAREPACRQFALLRAGRLLSRLRRRTPDAAAGYSILIYRLGREELSDIFAVPVSGP